MAIADLVQFRAFHIFLAYLREQATAHHLAHWNREVVSIGRGELHQELKSSIVLLSLIDVWTVSTSSSEVRAPPAAERIDASPGVSLSELP